MGRFSEIACGCRWRTELAAHLVASASQGGADVGGGGEMENKHPARQKLSAVQSEIASLKAELGL